MRIHGSAVLGFLLVTGCVADFEPGPPAAEIRSSPSILYMGPGETEIILVEAFVGNEPESVRWSIGMTGAGLTVVEDTSYGRVYVGDRLALPDQSHSRQFEVTMSDTVETSFVISGGTGVVTIPVRPLAP
jgi:hypothetical protein